MGQLKQAMKTNCKQRLKHRENGNIYPQLSVYLNFLLVFLQFIPHIFTHFTSYSLSDGVHSPPVQHSFICLCLLHSQVCLFLKRGASQTEVDEQGHDPLSIAVQAANADIVTL